MAETKILHHSSYSPHLQLPFVYLGPTGCHSTTQQNNKTPKMIATFVICEYKSQDIEMFPKKVDNAQIMRYTMHDNPERHR